MLGTQAALETASALYREAAGGFAPTFDWFFLLRPTGGIVDTSRFERKIQDTFDERLRGQLLNEFAEGRRLATATTDFDLGVGRIWDLGREMTATPDGLARAHTLLLATTAIPGIFPPVLIDGHVHSDGGVVSNVLSVLDFDGYRRLSGRLRELGIMETVTVRLWVVMNMWTHARLTVIDPVTRRAMAQRSNALLFWTQQPQLLARLSDLARAVSADVAGLRVEMRYTAIPSELASEPGAAALFDEDWMLRLEKFGYERARGASPWDEITSPYQRPVRVVPRP